jgi:hypothetical protein
LYFLNEFLLRKPNGGFPGFPRLRFSPHTHQSWHINCELPASRTWASLYKPSAANASHFVYQIQKLSGNNEPRIVRHVRDSGGNGNLN